MIEFKVYCFEPVADLGPPRTECAGAIHSLASPWDRPIRFPRQPLRAVNWVFALRAAVFLAAASACAAPKADLIDPSERFFTTNQVVRLGIRLDAPARAALQLQVAACWAGCLVGGDGPNNPPYYCAEHDIYYYTWDAIPDDCWESGTRPRPKPAHYP